MVTTQAILQITGLHADGTNVQFRCDINPQDALDQVCQLLSLISNTTEVVANLSLVEYEMTIGMVAYLQTWTFNSSTYGRHVDEENRREFGHRL